MFKKIFSALLVLTPVTMAVQTEQTVVMGGHGANINLNISGPYTIDVDLGNILYIRLPVAGTDGFIQGKELRLDEPTLAELQEDPICSMFIGLATVETISGQNKDLLTLENTEESQGYQVFNFSTGPNEGLRIFSLRSFDTNNPDDQGYPAYERTDLVKISVKAPAPDQE
jgi:hypothetical protein